jgi:hypothetical protein
MTDLNKVHSAVLLASATSSDTKLLVVFISVAGTALFLLAGRWLVDWHVQRRIRALVREHPELSIPMQDGDPKVADDSRSWFVRQRDAWVKTCELAPRPNLTASRMVLPTLLALVGVLTLRSSFKRHLTARSPAGWPSSSCSSSCSSASRHSLPAEVTGVRGGSIGSPRRWLR